MKKILSIIILTTLVFTMSTNVSAIGEITGTVRNTDIKAYINGLPVKSYNIDGWTGIVAEDLREYGFEVIWNGDARTLEVFHSIFADVTASYQFEENTKPIGSHAGYVYNTDILTYVNGEPVKGYNIGGQTIIVIDELQCYGDVVWNPEKREISYTRTEPWDINLHDETISPYNHSYDFPAADGIDSISVKYTKSEDGTYDYAIQSENLDHISWINLSYSKENDGLKLGFSMIANHLMFDEEFVNLCFEVSTVRYDGEILNNSAELANEYAKVYINGNSVKILKVTQGKGNNHMDYYFVLDSNIQKNDIKSFEFTFGK